jgi:hypothetical protein
MGIGKRALNAVIFSGLNSQPDDHSEGDHNMKTHTFKRALLPAAITAIFAGMTGVSSSALAAPTQFTATATVQSAVTLTQVTPLTFGTVFATKTLTPHATTASLAANGEKLTITAAGVASVTTATAQAGGVAIPKILSLGGAVAGQYSAPGLPDNGKVNIVFSDALGNAITPATNVATAECMYASTTTAVTGNKIILTNGADPTTGFFCMDVFTTNRLQLLDTSSTGGYSIGFGTTTLTFNLGATLIAQTPPAAGVVHTFQPGAYSGSFGMEVVFP